MPIALKIPEVQNPKPPTNAIEINVLCAVAVKPVLAELIQIFAKLHAIAVCAEFDLDGRISDSILAGEQFDIVIIDSTYARGLIDHGVVDAATHALLGRVPLAVARHDGGPGTVLTEPDEIRSLLLHAKSIAYTSSGSSGRAFLDAIDRLSLGDRISSCLRPMGIGQPALALAAGRVELAVLPMTTINATPDIDVTAIFPPTLQAGIEISVFLGKAPENRDQAIRFMNLLAETEIDAYLAAHGLFRAQD